jgi:DNA-binding NarL/FixJ family response regulator
VVIIDNVRVMIEERLTELDTERDQLKKLIAVIDNGSEPAAKRDEIAAIVNTPARGESRKAQIAQLLSEGMTPKDIAKKLECAPAYVYSVRRGASNTTET